MQRLTVTLGEQVPEIQSNALPLSIYRARDRAFTPGGDSLCPLQSTIALESPFAHTNRLTKR